MNELNKNYGLEYESVKDEDYIFGRSPLMGSIIKEDANWKDFIPGVELQAHRGFETSACVTFTTLNCVETLIKFKWNREENYSDRFLAKVSDTSITGNTPQRVAEHLRKVGVCTEEEYPYGGHTFDGFYQRIEPNLYELAKEFGKKYAFKHEYVENSRDIIFKALKTSPLGVSVTAWYNKDGMFYRPENSRNNHFTTLVYASYGEFWEVFDTYDKVMKKIPWNTDFDIIKRYSIEERGNETRETKLHAFCRLARLWWNDIFK